MNTTEYTYGELDLAYLTLATSEGIAGMIVCETNSEDEVDFIEEQWKWYIETCHDSLPRLELFVQWYNHTHRKVPSKIWTVNAEIIFYNTNQ